MPSPLWLTPKLLTSIDFLKENELNGEFDDKNAKLSGVADLQRKMVQGNTDLDVYSKLADVVFAGVEPPKLDANNPITWVFDNNGITVLPRNGSDLGGKFRDAGDFSPAGYQSSGIAASESIGFQDKKKLASLAEVVHV
ncbi:hypothetical protein SPFM12_00253 [Salmonella phage SPFM12]|nr:hypothetical protein SPFM12_00253 [Salmonella phage SPFM12]